MKCLLCKEEVDTSKEYGETKDKQSGEVLAVWHWPCYVSKGGE